MKTTHRHLKVPRAPRRRAPAVKVGDRYAPTPGYPPHLGPFVALTVVRVNPNGTVNVTETQTLEGIATMHVGLDPKRLQRVG